MMIDLPTRMVRMAGKAVGFGMILAALSAPAWAIPVPSPEIDPGSMAAGLTLLTGAVLMLSERRRRR